LFAGEEWVTGVFEATTVDALRRAVATDRVDLAAMPMPAGSASEHLDAVREVGRRSPDTVTVVLPGADDVGLALAAVRAGARGYLLDTGVPEAVRAALRTIAAGGLVIGPGIGPRVLQVLSPATHATARSVHFGPSVAGSPPPRSCLAP